VGLEEDDASMAANYVHVLEDQGIPLVDHVSGLTLSDPTDRLLQAQQILSGLPSGITHFIIHPSIDTPELRAITPDWQCRVADYHTFMDDDLRKYIKNIGLQIIGYKIIERITVIIDMMNCKNNFFMIIKKTFDTRVNNLFYRLYEPAVETIPHQD